MTTTYSFPEIITENQTTSVDFTLQKCESIIRDLESKPLESFGTGTQKDKLSKRQSLAERAIKNLVVGYLVSAGFPLISEEIFNIKRWYKIAFPKDQSPYLVEDSMVEPDWANTKQQENGVQVRWVGGKYLVGINPDNSSKTATLASLPYVGRRGTDLYLKANLPCEMPIKTEVLKATFFSHLLEIASQCYRSSTIFPYLRSNSSYDGGLSITNFSDLNALICWVPKTEHIYFEEVIVPPPSDPALIINWKGTHFFIDAWDTNNDHANLQTILDEFVV